MTEENAKLTTHLADRDMEVTGLRNRNNSLDILTKDLEKRLLTVHEENNRLGNIIGSNHQTIN